MGPQTTHDVGRLARLHLYIRSKTDGVTAGPAEPWPSEAPGPALVLSHQDRRPQAPRQLRYLHRLRSRTKVNVAGGNVVADSLQPLQDPLPLLPVQLSQIGPESLDERIFQQRLAI